MSNTGSGTTLISGRDQLDLTAVLIPAGQALTFTHNLGRRAYQVVVSDSVNGNHIDDADVTVTQTPNAVSAANSTLAAVTVYVAIRWENTSIDLDLVVDSDPRISVVVAPNLCAPYVPGQATNIFAGPLTVTNQADLDLLIGFDGFLGDLDISAANGAFGLDWTPLALMKEIDGSLLVDQTEVSDLPPFPALKYVSVNALIIVNTSEAVFPSTYMGVLARVDSTLNLSFSVSALTFNMDDCFPLLHTVGRVDLNMSFGAGGDMSMVGSFSCLETGSFRVSESGGSPSTLDLQGAFANLIETSPTSDPGIKLGNFNITNVVGAFPVLATVYQSLELRPFPFGALVPSFAAVTTIGRRFHVQSAQGVDFSATLLNLITVGSIIVQQSDSCVFPTFPVLVTANGVGLGPSIQLQDNTNMVGGLPTFPVLTTTRDRIAVSVNSLTVPTVWVPFPVLTRIGPLGGPYQDFSFQQNTDVLLGAGSFPSLLFVDDITISDNIGALDLQSLCAVLTTANDITIDTNDISSTDSLFAVLATVSTLILNNNTGTFSLAAVDGAFVALTTALKIHVISDTGLLSAVGVFPVLATVTGGALVGDLIISSCANLTDVTAAFPVLISAGDHVGISGCPLITTVTDVAPLLTTAGRVNVTSNAALASIVDSFASLTTTTVSAVSILSNPSLVLIDGSFTSLVSCEGLIMHDNGAVVFANGTFDVLTTITIDCILSGGIGNAGFALGTLDAAFPVLASVGDLKINNLPFVTSLATAFPSLVSFSIGMQMNDNLLLNDISGLLVLNGLACGFAPIDMQNNVSLSTVGQINPLVADLVGEGWTGLGGSTFFGNAP